MKKILITIAVLAVAGAIALAFVNINPLAGTSGSTAESTTYKAAEGEIQWMTWDEAVKAGAKKPKKVFVDCYTDWCGWCKRMDATTFKDPAVVEYMNKNFYAVKFDAEQKTDINWRGTTFKFIPSGRRGVHQLAYSLLDGRLGYPSFVYLDEKFDRVSVSPGFKQPDQLIQELKWVSDGHYKSKTFDQYSKGM